MAEPVRLLVVCLGNICRSPTCQSPVPAESSVTFPASVEVLMRARQLSEADYRDFDWLLCADRANLRDVRARAPAGAHARIALLLEWAGVEDEGEIPDPYTGGASQFEHVYQLLDRAADGVIARLRHEYPSRLA